MGQLRSVARGTINVDRNFEKQNNHILREKEDMKLTVWIFAE
jgi:hypothetical protein